MLVAADDDLGARRNGAFQDPVVVGIIADDSKPLGRMDQDRLLGEEPERRVDPIPAPIELLVQHTGCLQAQGLGYRQPERAGECRREEVLGQPAEMEGRDIDIGVDGNGVTQVQISRGGVPPRGSPR